MSEMPDLYIRNVPRNIVVRFKRRAKQNGRSLNAEIIEALEASVEDQLRREGLAKRLEELRAEYVIPEGAPDAVDVIRKGRDDRARQIERRARGS